MYLFMKVELISIIGSKKQGKGRTKGWAAMKFEKEGSSTIVKMTFPQWKKFIEKTAKKSLPKEEVLRLLYKYAPSEFQELYYDKVILKKQVKK